MEGYSYGRARKQLGVGVYIAYKLRLLFRNGFAVLRILGQQRRSVAVRQYGVRSRGYDVFTPRIQQAFL